MRLSQKTVIEKTISNDRNLGTDFNKPLIDGTVQDKGYQVIHEKAYICPCKSKESDHRNTCKNCGGTGWIFANPTRTRMIITGIMSDDKMKEGALRDWGMMDMGNVKVTADDSDKLTYMDKIVNLDATAEHNQVLYPVFNDAEDQLFVFTKYDIKGIDFVGLFEAEGTKVKRLVEITDFTYHDNILVLNSSYHNLVDPCITIRYIHNPTYHIIDIMRESMTSYKDNGNTKIVLPVHAVAKRAHLITDVENFDGDRLLDNSWKPGSCDDPEMTKFQRQLRYSTSQYIYDNLTSTQRTELLALLS